ncbi:hypothetical protein GCM10025865_05250 [Paraoerskovia sediminicola]|uniref:Uncharacterized protein n=1 Tax=Paraoerskovia sediminicola TaxID=1138587 RepID=A0ABM8FZM5_9CELL|nr:hypothetical protein [Paraoerskovia sediminicola]BDZ41226.1 hypothetical protein GCM10025865_05250 [Paraoerskovia sediminicola]
MSQGAALAALAVVVVVGLVLAAAVVALVVIGIRALLRRSREVTTPPRRSHFRLGTQVQDAPDDDRDLT